MPLNILVDTNIFIKREDPIEIDNKLSKIFKKISEKGDTIYIHEKSKEDLLNDKDDNRKKVMLSKINAYPCIKSNNYYQDDEYCSKIKISDKKNDKIDAEILYSLYNQKIDFLITEDKMIHKNSIKLGLENNVFTVDEFYEYIYIEDNIHSPKLIKTTVDQLDVNDPIFNTLKKDYNEFLYWFKKIQKEHRPAFIYQHENKELGAVLIYKEIEEETIELKNEVLPPKKRLKIATLYVAESRNKIGESLLKNIFKKAKSVGVDEIYLTHFTKDDDVLVPFIEKYGFELKGLNSRNEEVFIKNMNLNEIKVNFSKYNNDFISTKYFPYYSDNKNIDKFIVPILPKYYLSLFDTSQKTVDDYLDDTFPEDLVQINAIQKAYISKSHTNLKKGDLIIFYESKKGGLKEIGVVTDFLKSDDLNEIKNIIGKRSVFKDEEINNQIKELKNNSNLSVILFNHVESIDISFNDLKDKIDFKPPQTIQSISESKYMILKELVK